MTYKTIAQLQHGLKILEEKALEDRYTKYTSNTRSLDTGDTSSVTRPSYRFEPYTQYTSANIWRKIHDDEVFKLALEWGSYIADYSTGELGLSDKLLNFYCETYGVAFIRGLIQRISKRHDSYWKGADPKNEQRVKLLKYIIGKEGVKA